MPTGSPNCLSGLTFIPTGTFDTLRKDQICDLIEACGGELATSMRPRSRTGKTMHQVLIRGWDGSLFVQPGERGAVKPRSEWSLELFRGKKFQDFIIFCGVRRFSRPGQVGIVACLLKQLAAN